MLDTTYLGTGVDGNEFLAIPAKARANGGTDRNKTNSSSAMGLHLSPAGPPPFRQPTALTRWTAGGGGGGRGSSSPASRRPMYRRLLFYVGVGVAGAPAPKPPPPPPPIKVVATSPFSRGDGTHSAWIRTNPELSYVRKLDRSL